MTKYSFHHLLGVNYHLMSPVHTSSPNCNGYLAFICWGANSTDCSHVSALAQVGLRVPTPDAERSIQSSCELMGCDWSRTDTAKVILRAIYKRRQLRARVTVGGCKMCIQSINCIATSYFLVCVYAVSRYIATQA